MSVRPGSTSVQSFKGIHQVVDVLWAYKIFIRPSVYNMLYIVYMGKMGFELGKPWADGAGSCGIRWPWACKGSVS